MWWLPQSLLEYLSVSLPTHDQPVHQGLALLPMCTTFLLVLGQGMLTDSEITGMPPPKWASSFGCKLHSRMPAHPLPSCHRYTTSQTHSAPPIYPALAGATCSAVVVGVLNESCALSHFIGYLPQVYIFCGKYIYISILKTPGFGGHFL